MVGEQADSLDLVNGDLEEQLELVKSIASEYYSLNAAKLQLAKDSAYEDIATFTWQDYGGAVS